MTMEIRVAAIAALLLLGSSCTRAVGDGAVRLVLETSAPSRPPTVELVVRSGAHDRAVPGVLYTADWETRKLVTKTAPRIPVPWPVASAIDRRHATTVTLDTRASPDYVEVSSFATVAADTGRPTSAPIATFECSRFTAPRCEVSRTKKGLALTGPSEPIVRGAYVAVFCTWHVPRSEQPGGANPVDDVSATWLFHLDDGHGSKALPRDL